MLSNICITRIYIYISLTGIEKILFFLLKRKKGMAGMNVIFEPPSRNEETEIVVYIYIFENNDTIINKNDHHS